MLTQSPDTSSLPDICNTPICEGSACAVQQGNHVAADAQLDELDRLMLLWSVSALLGGAGQSSCSNGLSGLMRQGQEQGMYGATARYVWVNSRTKSLYTKSMLLSASHTVST